VLLIDSVGEIMGGAQVVVDEILHRVDRTTTNVSVVCLGEGSWPERLRSEGFTVHVVPRTRWRDIANVRRVTKQLRTIIDDEGIDLVHASENSSLLYATLAGRWAGRPVVWHVFDPLSGATRRRELSARLLSSLRPDWIIFGTASAAPELPRPSSIPTSTVLPGVDVARCRSGDGARARRALGIAAEAPVIATFGRVEPAKGQIDFVRALRRVRERHPGVRGVVCGRELDPEYSQWVRHVCARHGLTDAVSMTGFVSDSERLDLLAAADVVVHAAHREAFGLVVAEAMAAGKAVVACATTGPRSLIDDGVSGLLVPVESVGALTAAVNGLLDDPAARSRMGAQAQIAAGRHTVGQMVAGVQRVWSRVLGPADPPG
jgi:glycosyltransferase involved in cell wall biosynthesis